MSFKPHGANQISETYLLPTMRTDEPDPLTTATKTATHSPVTTPVDQGWSTGGGKTPVRGLRQKRWVALSRLARLRGGPPGGPRIVWVGRAKQQPRRQICFWMGRQRMSPTLYRDTGYTLNHLMEDIKVGRRSRSARCPATLCLVACEGSRPVRFSLPWLSSWNVDVLGNRR